MAKTNQLLSLACIIAMAAATGCVTGTRQLAVPTPTSSSYPKDPSKGTVAIGAIRDVRHFENKPAEPSTPSIDGDVTQLSDAARGTFIGRQRNTYGHAMGDVALADGQTVQGKLGDLLREGFRRRGYEVVATGQSPNVVTADIQQFWSWMTPGAFVLTFEVQINCTIEVTHNGQKTTLTVKGYGKNHGQLAKDENWTETFDEAFADFFTDLDRKMAAAGL